MLLTYLAPGSQRQLKICTGPFLLFFARNHISTYKAFSVHTMQADAEEELNTHHGGICSPPPRSSAGKRSSVPTDYCTSVFILYSGTFSGLQC